MDICYSALFANARPSIRLSVPLSVMNVERFAPTDLDRSRFEKECNYCRAPIVTTWADFSCVR